MFIDEVDALTLRLSKIDRRTKLGRRVERELNEKWARASYQDLQKFASSRYRAQTGKVKNAYVVYMFLTEELRQDAKNALRKKPRPNK